VAPVLRLNTDGTARSEVSWRRARS